MRRRSFRNIVAPDPTSQGERHIRKKSMKFKLSQDVAIQNQYKIRAANPNGFEDFGNVVRKSTKKFEEALRASQAHMAAAETANNFADEKVAYENALQSCTEALAFASQHELARGYYHRAMVLHRLNENVTALSDIHYALSSLHDQSDGMKTEIENLKQSVWTTLQGKADEVLRPLQVSLHIHTYRYVNSTFL